MIEKKYQTFSRLLSKAKQLFLRYFSRLCRRCSRAFERAETVEEAERVKTIIGACPEGECECCRVSEHSHGPVRGNERLARFVLSPVHVDKKGRIKPSLFSHAATKGCSIQRESASTDELLAWLEGFLRKGKPDVAWCGVVVATAETVRSLRAARKDLQCFAVYDTAQADNVSHAEIFESYPIDEADGPEARKELLRIFSGETFSSQQYRNSDLWKRLSPDLQARQAVPLVKQP